MNAVAPSLIRAGSKWGHLELLKVEFTGAQDGAVWDSHGGPTIWTLRCDCGHIWTLDMALFQSKRQTRSCGRESCPYTMAAEAQKRRKWDRMAKREQKEKKKGRPRGRPVGSPNRPKTLVPRPWQSRGNTEAEKRAQVTYYLACRVNEEVRKYAEKRGRIAVGRAAEELIELGLAALVVEQV